MSIYISVGKTVVGSFSSTTSREAVRCIRMLAPGCSPRIKKCPDPYEYRTQKRNNNEARQRVKFLQPGEFTL